MQRLSAFHNLHKEADIIVCGCGASLNDLAEPERFITIGVNDVGRRFDPDYLVVVNPRSQFAGDRFGYVERSRARYLFTQLDLGIDHPNIVRFRLGAFGGTDFAARDALDYTNNSPYIALNLAILMGARRVGLIGVDFTDHHFFAETGRHPLAPQLDAIDEQYTRLAAAAKSHGVEIFNLSRISRLTAFPKISIAEFQSAKGNETQNTAQSTTEAEAEKSAPMKIVSYSTMPVAGVPAILARCINAQTPHAARCVWATNSYGSGVTFTGDVEWRDQPRLAEELLADADLVIVHNGKVATAHEKLLAGKPVLTMAHNYRWNVDTRFVEQGFPGAVVGQYQASLPEFEGWHVVPNPLPFWENDYQNRTKTPRVSICYTPFGKHEQYAATDKLYWHSKGFETTSRILEKLAEKFDVNLEIVAAGQVSHTAALAMKCRSHIVIDECVTGSYHRNSLEGLAAAAVVVNGLGKLPEITRILKKCAGKKARSPFVCAALEDLEKILEMLLRRGTERLEADGAENRRWIESHWVFAEQWRKFWLPSVRRARRHARDRTARKTGFARVEGKTLNTPERKITRRGNMCMTIAKNDDLNLPEFAAFNHGFDYPRMRRWELPFALFQLRLTGFMSVLDCTINPVNFGERLANLYPNAVYRSFKPISGKRFDVPYGFPDEEFDRVVCVNTLEHLLKPQRADLLAEMARKLKPGGRLVITCDQYPDDFREKKELLKMGLVRADGEEVFNGFNRVTSNELIDTLEKYGLQPLQDNDEAVGEAEKLRNVEPYPHTCLGMVFVKGQDMNPLPGKKIMLGLLSWNTKETTLDALEAYRREAEMLARLGCAPFLAVCDNGSTDGTAEALAALDKKLETPHEFIINRENKGSSVARNQIIDLLLKRGDDYLLMMDGDIEIVPFSSFAMLRRMEEQGRRLGCLGPHSSGFAAERSKTTRYQFDLTRCRKEFVNYVAWTQYGMFRREVFADGVRFDENKPFNGEGWGFEDNDLAFQMLVKGYRIEVFTGMTYLHRNVHSSIRVMKAIGSDPRASYEKRRDYVIKKWNNSDFIPPAVINSLQISKCPQV